MMNTGKFYEAILDLRWDGMDEHAAWLQSRCDSQLEVMFGMALLGLHCIVMQRECDDCGYMMDGEAIALMEPFVSSPDQNGASAAFLSCQYRDGKYAWDFCIHTAQDNGAKFSESTPNFLVDIDGYKVHRSHRLADENKLAEASICAMRLPEERFTGPVQMAEAVLWSSVWACFGCRYNKYDGWTFCPECKDAKARAIFSKQHNWVNW